ncbi:hypothetical protein VP01_4534g1, partial [Puccinia sorghi]
ISTKLRMPTTREAYLKHQPGENHQKRHQNDWNTEFNLSGHNSDPTLPPEQITWYIRKY